MAEHPSHTGPSPAAGEGSTAATNRTAAEMAALGAAAAGAPAPRTVDADRARVFELLDRLQRFIRGGGVRMWDGVDEHQAHADLEYARDAVARFPGADGPLFSEDVSLLIGIDQERHNLRLDVTAAGRVVISTQDGQRIVDMDTVTVTRQLLRLTR